ncbi:MAG: leucine-rich repeat domain-containing protein [Anaeroplasmataceae bacterium]|nr:leucine-rich repeat domain-containing protein [Anaeroplasmataceae bacterium]
MRKKVFLIAFLSFSLFLFCGCGEKDNPPSGGDGPSVVNPPVTEHTHSWGEWREEAATCTVSGKKTRTCSGCDKVETENIPALNHNFKDGYCTRCDEVDPKNTDMIDGKEFLSVKISNDGLLTFSRLKCASKYVLKISNASTEEVIELDKTKGAYSLATLPVGRTMVTLTAYEKVEVKVENETHYQDVPISTATDEFRITKVNQTYSLERLRYTDEYITLEGFYDEPRIDSKTNEKYYLYETVYKAPSLSNIMNNSQIKDARNFKLKDTSKYKLVYYESDGKTSFTLGASHYMNVERAGYSKYYIAVVEKDTNKEVKRYPIQTYGLTTVELKFRKLAITIEDGIRKVEASTLRESLFFTEKDILSKEDIYRNIDSGLLGRTGAYTLLDRDSDFIIPASNMAGEVVLYFYERDLVSKDCEEYKKISKDFVLYETDYGWSLTARNDVKEVCIPAQIMGRPVIGANLSSTAVESLVLEEGITQWICRIQDCANLTSISLPDTIVSMERHSFAGIRTDCIIYCDFVKAVGDTFSIYWNGISGSYNTYKTVYLDSVRTINGCQIEIKDGVASVVGYTEEFNGLVPKEVSVGKKSYPVKKIAENAFADCLVTEIIVEEGIETIGRNAFVNCTNLEKITLPFIGSELNSLTNAYFGYIFGASSANNNSGYVPAGLKEVVIIGGKAIGSQAFYGCSSIESIIVKKDVVQIGNNAFYNCNSLVNIELPISVTDVNSRAFYRCYTIKKMIVPHACLPYIPSNLEELKLLDGERLEESTLPSVQNLYLPKTLTYVGSNSSTTIKNIYFEGTIEDWCKIKFEDSLFTYSSEEFKSFYIKKDSEWERVETLTIPEGIEEIGNYQFYGFDSVTRVEMYEGILRIGNQAFAYCKGLENIILPDSLIEIKPYAFLEVENLTYTEHENGLYIGNKNNPYLCLMKMKDTSAREFNIHNNTRVIYSTEATNLTKIRLPQNVVSIGAYAFGRCKIYEVQLPKSLKHIGELALSSYVDWIKYEGTIEDWCKVKLDSYIFESWANSNTFSIQTEEGDWLHITTIEIPDTITQIGDYQFYCFNNITSVVVPDSVTSIGTKAFAHCEKLKNITLPFIGQNKDGTGVFGSIFGAEHYGENSKTPQSLKEVKITGGEVIVENAFTYCLHIEKLILPKSIIHIEATPFVECRSMTIYCEVEEAPSGWQGILSAGNRVYYYSETEPIHEGNYWHYVDDVPTKW